MKLKGGLKFIREVSVKTLLTSFLNRKDGDVGILKRYLIGIFLFVFLVTSFIVYSTFSIDKMIGTRSTDNVPDTAIIKRKVGDQKSSEPIATISESLAKYDSIEATTNSITQIQFDKAMERSKKWLNKRGYFVMDEFIELEERDNYDVMASDYNSYTTEQLRTLAENQDPKAQMFYGLTLLPTDFEAGEEWLKQSIVTGNYTSVVLSLIDGALLKIEKMRYQRRVPSSSSLETSKSNSGLEIGDSEPQLDFKTEIAKYENKILVWDRVSKMLGDPLASANLVGSEEELQMTAKQHSIIEKQSEALFHKLNSQREAFGLEEFYSESINSQDLYILSNFLEE